MTRHARSGLSLVASLLGLVLIPATAAIAWIAVADEPSDLPEPGDLQVALIRAGLDADALAASGLTTQETTDVVEDFAVAMAAELDRLADADADYAEARVTTDALRRKVRSGLASEQEASDLQTAKFSLSTAESARQATLDDWFEAGTASLAGAKTATLATLRSNRDWKLPVEFLVVDRSEEEWVAVRKALANERICAKYEDPPDVGMQASLATWRAAPACAAAKVAFDLNGDSVRAAWDAAIEG